MTKSKYLYYFVSSEWFDAYKELICAAKKDSLDTIEMYYLFDNDLKLFFDSNKNKVSGVYICFDVLNNSKIKLISLKNGLLHNDYGPADVSEYSEDLFYLNGILYSRDDFIEKQKKTIYWPKLFAMMLGDIKVNEYNVDIF